MHVCPDSGGAHHYHPDANGVRLCSCGEVELTVDDELALIEMTRTPPLPADRARSLYQNIKDRTGLPIDVDDLVDRIERPDA